MVCYNQTARVDAITARSNIIVERWRLITVIVSAKASPRENECLRTEVRPLRACCVWCRERGPSASRTAPCHRCRRRRHRRGSAPTCRRRVDVRRHAWVNSTSHRVTPVRSAPWTWQTRPNKAPAGRSYDVDI